MGDDRDLLALMRAIAGPPAGRDAAERLAAHPHLARAALVAGATRSKPGDHYFADHGIHVYAGDTALHVAAFAYDVPTARALVAAGADVRARNRRGAEPLHSAANGGPGAPAWDPARQAATITYLVQAGADPDAVAAGDVTALHRAVRNRCGAAVEALLAAGADARRPNGSGSTPLALARGTTGRSGSGSPEARAEQARIVAMLEAATGG
jgi:hypothetical protein